jgi:SH3 domain-containing YSC84-like protein 1
MKRIAKYWLMLCLAIFCIDTLVHAATTREVATSRLENAADVLHEIMNTPDKGIPSEVLSSAKCVAVVPHLLKGAFIFGAKRGKGVATCRTKNGWSAPTFFTITGGSWGLQIGVEGVDLVMTIMNNKGMQDMLSSKFQIGASASASAGPVGRHASAGTDWKLDTEILTYSRSKGVFAGISLNGSWISQDDDSVKAIYKRPLTPKAILSGSVAAPTVAQSFLDALRFAETQAKKNA